MTDTNPVPSADRPRMFGSSGLSPVLLPWSWAEERLVAARNYWVSSTLPDGTPHARPVWGVWRAGACWFSTGSRASATLVAGAPVTIHLESGDEVVIIDGRTEPTHDRADEVALCDAYNAKYRWDLDPDALPGTILRVRPVVVFGWVSDGSGSDGGAAFHGSTTRWRF